MSFGQRLKLARKHVGILQKELAKKLGTTPQNLAQYETGKRMPKPETVLKIANALKLECAYTRTGEPFFYDFTEDFSNINIGNPQSFNVKQIEDAANYSGLSSAEAMDLAMTNHILCASLTLNGNGKLLLLDYLDKILLEPANRKNTISD